MEAEQITISKKQYKKLQKGKLINTALDIILLLLLIAMGIYFFKHIDIALVMLEDPCRVCEQQTGGTCIKFLTSDNPIIR